MNFKINKKWLSIGGYFLAFLIPFLLFFAIQFGAKTFMCPDSFYHAKMASFLASGQLIKIFPWLPYSIFTDCYIDHHFLYHLLLVPFVIAFNSAYGIKIATLFFSTVTIFFFYVFLKKFKIKFPLFWTLLLLTSGVFLTRISLDKVPAAIWLVLLLGFYALFKRKLILLAIVSFVYVWFYNTWPIFVVAVIIYCFANALRKIIENWQIFSDYKSKFLNFLKYLFAWENLKIILACLIGVIFGLIINPYFPQNLPFDWIHIVKIGLKNYQNFLPVGIEWYPYEPLSLIINNLFIFGLWLIGIGWFFVSLKKNKDNNLFGQSTGSIFLFIFSLLFFIFTIKSRRNVDYFIPLMVLFSAFSLNEMLKNFPWKKYFEEFKNLKKFPFSLITVIIILCFLLLLIFAGKSFFETTWKAKVEEFKGGASFETFKKSADFLKNNTQPGEIIFHDSWDEFPALFYHNDKNYYLAGLDPTFFYEKDKPLYWLWFNITTNRQKYSLAATLKNTFKTNYALIKDDRKILQQTFNEDLNFEKIYDDNEVNIYKLKIFSDEIK